MGLVVSCCRGFLAGLGPVYVSFLGFEACLAFEKILSDVLGVFERSDIYVGS